MYPHQRWLPQSRLFRFSYRFFDCLLCATVRMTVDVSLPDGTALPLGDRHHQHPRVATLFTHRRWETPRRFVPDVNPQSSLCLCSGRQQEGWDVLTSAARDNRSVLFRQKLIGFTMSDHWVRKTESSVRGKTPRPMHHTHLASRRWGEGGLPW